jgi:alkanesulfonate monooxygenase SsuD/methylene tetrahydromethanopterin reductase-like flavin-dependent oxidoreductase (luciferase family)
MAETNARGRVGVNIPLGPPRDTVDLIRRAEAAGVETAWTIMLATGWDLPTVYAAAMAQTNRIRLATGIVPAFTRHPLALAAQALALEGLAPGRLLLGIGTSHGANIAGAYGLPFDRPLARLREYLQVLRSALGDGSVSFAGEFYRVEAKLLGSAPTPVLISALRHNAWELAGELSDGGIAWVTPHDYLLARAKPALRHGAERAGRPAPPLVAHVLVALETDEAAARGAARHLLARYVGIPFYARMFADAGHPLGPDDAPSDALVDQLLVFGDDAAVAAGLRARLAIGLDELLATAVTGPGARPDLDRLFRLVGGL